MSIALKEKPSFAGTTGSAFGRDAVIGLGADPKRLPSKYFYDQRGSELFERITRLPEYYPTRTEIGILESHAAEITKLLPADAALIESGAGPAEKTRKCCTPRHKYPPTCRSISPVNSCRYGGASCHRIAEPGHRSRPTSPAPSGCRLR